MSEINLEPFKTFFRTVCLPKRVCLAYFTYGPLITFLLGIVTLPGHIILFPYYILLFIVRGKPPKFLYYWVFFQSAYIYGAIHNKENVWQDFSSIYFIYIGFFITFINWILTVVSSALIFPIFIYIEEWRLLTSIMYRINFGCWKKIIHDCPEITNKRRQKREKVKETIYNITKDGKLQDVEEIEIEEKKTFYCPLCGIEIDRDTTYCPKCGSYIRH